MAETEFYGGYNQEHSSSDSTALSIAKVFGYMFAGLLITAVVALGLGALFRYVIYDTEESLAGSTALIVTLICSSVAILIFSLIIQYRVLRGHKSVLVPAIIYAILMGVMLSSLSFCLPWAILGATFLVTALIFGLMSLIGLLSKGKMNGLAITAIGLVGGAGILSLVAWIEYLIFPEVAMWLFFVINLVLFAAMMLMTIWDIAHIKNICQRGLDTPNISLYCAFTLYNDFIYLYLRILRVVIILFGNKK